MISKVRTDRCVANSALFSRTLLTIETECLPGVFVRQYSEDLEARVASTEPNHMATILSCRSRFAAELPLAHADTHQ